MAECKKCIHEVVCESAKACDGRVPGCEHFKEGWISVNDRLPEKGQEVIVYSGGVLKSTVFAYQFWNKNYDSWARITHWMPLPQPPKGE